MERGMLDRKTLGFLKELNSLCGEGSYKVIDSAALIEKAPKRLALNEDVIEDMLKYLKQNEYIDIKYSENKVYCLTVLSKGRALFEKIKDDSKLKSSFRKYVFWSVLGSAVAAFLGAFLAVWLFK